ncbi:DgyrCDS5586 [Dimorphilus gyrociliatus]|uniref:DgyrCDS5586 n=1 Tax=Dimorphilus gyrociliatus TaxID=2664684 RepID=A0A7I8VKG6_9ANNE|nr:DgyrCDS5586 [Dimorphilus gyrociliatus]
MESRQRRQFYKPEIVDIVDSIRQRKKISSVGDFSIRAWILVALTLPVGLFTLYCFFLFSTVGLPSPSDVAENVYHFTNDVHRSLSSNCPLWLSSKDLQEIRNSKELLTVLSEKSTFEADDLIRKAHPFVWKKLATANLNIPNDIKSCESVQTIHSPLILHWQRKLKVKLSEISLKDDPCFSGVINLRIMDNSELEEVVYNTLSPRRLSYFRNKLDIIELLYLYMAKNNLGIPPKFPNECGIFTLHQISGIANYTLSWPVGNHGLIEMNKPKHFQLEVGDMVIFYSGMRLHMESVSDCSMSVLERMKDKNYCPYGSS